MPVLDNYLQKELTVMEINKLQGNAISAYKKISAGTSAASRAQTKKLANTDKVEFDFSSSLAAAKANVASSVEAEANTSRIEELQRLYAGDNCPVTAQEVAEKIVD